MLEALSMIEEASGVTAPSETCSTCVYWDPLPVGSRAGVDSGAQPAMTGRCRRYPPVAAPQEDPSGSGAEVVYVHTDAAYWCGEWQARTQDAETLQPQRAPEAPAAKIAPLMDLVSYARLRRLYTVGQLRGLVLTGEGDEEATLGELARLEATYQDRLAGS